MSDDSLAEDSNNCSTTNWNQSDLNGGALDVSDDRPFDVATEETLDNQPPNRQSNQLKAQRQLDDSIPPEKPKVDEIKIIVDGNDSSLDSQSDRTDSNGSNESEKENQDPDESGFHLNDATGNNAEDDSAEVKSSSTKDSSSDEVQPFNDSHKSETRLNEPVHNQLTEAHDQCQSSRVDGELPRHAAHTSDLNSKGDAPTEDSEAQSTDGSSAEEQLHSTSLDGTDNRTTQEPSTDSVTGLDDENQSDHRAEQSISNEVTNCSETFERDPVESRVLSDSEDLSADQDSGNIVHLESAVDNTNDASSLRDFNGVDDPPTQISCPSSELGQDTDACLGESSYHRATETDGIGHASAPVHPSHGVDPSDSDVLIDKPVGDSQSSLSESKPHLENDGQMVECRTNFRGGESDSDKLISGRPDGPWMNTESNPNENELMAGTECAGEHDPKSGMPPMDAEVHPTWSDVDGGQDSASDAAPLFQAIKSTECPCEDNVAACELSTDGQAEFTEESEPTSAAMTRSSQSTNIEDQQVAKGEHDESVPCDTVDRSAGPERASVENSCLSEFAGQDNRADENTETDASTEACEKHSCTNATAEETEAQSADLRIDLEDAPNEQHRKSTAIESAVSVESDTNAVAEALSDDNIKEELVPLSDGPTVTFQIEDILGDRTLLKQTTAQGEPNTRPTRSTLVTASYRLWLTNGPSSNDRLIEDVQNERFFVSEDDVIRAIDIGVQSMNRGESAVFDSDIRLCYGSAGCPELGVPAASTINPYRMKIEIGLQDWQRPVDVEKLTVEERLYWGNKKKQMGNFHYRRQDYAVALQCYNGALRFLDTGLNRTPTDITQRQESELKDGFIQVENNAAQAYLLLSRYDECLQAVDRVLFHDPKNMKALFRRGKAFFQLGSYDKAIEPLRLFLKGNGPSSEASVDAEKANEMIQVCQSKLAEYDKNEKEIYQRMFKPSSTTTVTTDQGEQAPINKQIRRKTSSWWPYVAVGGAVAIGLVVFKFLKRR